MRFHYTPEEMEAWKEFVELHGENAGLTAVRAGKATMYWLYPPVTQTDPPKTETTTIVISDGTHPLEPKPVKKCTCGAHACGHNGHSSWCDSLT